jgi:hypothetical protein
MGPLIVLGVICLLLGAVCIALWQTGVYKTVSTPVVSVPPVSIVNTDRLPTLIIERAATARFPPNLTPRVYPAFFLGNQVISIVRPSLTADRIMSGGFCLLYTSDAADDM